MSAALHNASKGQQKLYMPVPRSCYKCYYECQTIIDAMCNHLGTIKCFIKQNLYSIVYIYKGIVWFIKHMELTYKCMVWIVSLRFYRCLD